MVPRVPGVPHPPTHPPTHDPPPRPRRGPDAAEFRPERWLEEDGPAARAHPFAYQPFSKGPRDCIGQQFALIELRTVLALMYSR